MLSGGEDNHQFGGGQGRDEPGEGIRAGWWWFEPGWAIGAGLLDEDLRGVFVLSTAPRAH
jgi:hypothetical protein